MAPFHSLQASTPSDILSDPTIRSELQHQYTTFKRGGKHLMRLQSDEKDQDFTELIQKGRLSIEEGYFSSRDRLEAMALVQRGENTGPEWGQPTTALLAHYACVDGQWKLQHVETWYSEIVAQDVDADGLDEIWVRQPRDGMMAGAESLSLMSFEGREWTTLWEHEGTDLLAHTDFDQSPPKDGDVLLEKESLDVRWASGQAKPTVYLRREVRICHQPQCRTVEDLDTQVTWKRMIRKNGTFQPTE